MAGDYYNSQAENPANRAKVSPSIFSQILGALGGLIGDTISPKKYQDRGSAAPFSTDILKLNSQETPPATEQFDVPENAELRNSHQSNEKQFRFLGINTGQAGNKDVTAKTLFGPRLNPNHTPMFKGRFLSLNEILGTTPRSNIRFAGTFTNVSGKKVIDQSQQTAEASGASGGSSGGASGSGSSGGFSGGGRSKISSF